MAQNNIELVRVFTRETNAIVAATTFPYNTAFEVVIECKAGTAIHAMGAKYEIKIDVIDFSVMASVVRSASVAVGFLGDAGWLNKAQQFVYHVAAPGAVNESHVWKVFASLKVGIASPYVSLAESGLILITSP